MSTLALCLHRFLYGQARSTAYWRFGKDTTANEAKSDLKCLVRPPIETTVVDAELWEQWLAFDRPVVTIYRFMEQGILIGEADTDSIISNY